MSAVPTSLDANKIRAALRTPSLFEIDVLAQATSSNSILLQRAAEGAPSGSVLAVEAQTAGRGRWGRTWHSEPADALTFSLLWHFERGLSSLAGLSLAVGLALLRVFQQLGMRQIHLKWPNDVVSVQGKLAGILLEAQGEPAGKCRVVIGIGLNLRASSYLISQINQQVSTLEQQGVALPERNHLLALLLQAQADMLQDFAQSSFAPLRAEWEAAHRDQQQPIKIHTPDGQTITGVARGVTDDGALQVETAQGWQLFHAGEVSLRGAS